jgi:peptide/nickel transport system ATP-binding protein
MENQRLIEVSNLKKYFPVKKGFFRTVSGYVRAVDEIDFYINKGETLGIVGESGCGKTTIGKCIIRAMKPTEGSIYFRDFEGNTVDIASLPERELRPIRSRMQFIFQDPYASLDPRMTIMDIIGEPLKISKKATGNKLRKRIRELTGLVGLNTKYLNRYPHAFSGGQRQRIGIARAISTDPELIICDEAVSALDVSIRAQILNLLLEMQAKLGLSYLFISHDLSVVHHVSHRVAVIYAGKIVETASTKDIYLRPKHPYTEALLSAILDAGFLNKKQRILLKGEVANPVEPPTGCRFHPRCIYREKICKEEIPKLIEVSSGHFAACHFHDKLTLGGIAI